MLVAVEQGQGFDIIDPLLDLVPCSLVRTEMKPSPERSNLWQRLFPQAKVIAGRVFLRE